MTSGEEASLTSNEQLPDPGNECLSVNCEDSSLTQLFILRLQMVSASLTYLTTELLWSSSTAPHPCHQMANQN